MICWQGCQTWHDILKQTNCLTWWPPVNNCMHWCQSSYRCLSELLKMTIVIHCLLQHNIFCVTNITCPLRIDWYIFTPCATFTAAVKNHRSIFYFFVIFIAVISLSMNFFYDCGTIGPRLQILGCIRMHFIQFCKDWPSDDWTWYIKMHNDRTEN